MEVVVPLAVALFLGVPAVILAAMGLPAAQRSRIIRLALLALAARLALSSIFEVFESTRVFHADSVGAEYYGDLVASIWRGEAPPVPLPDKNYGFYYILGAFEYAFGRYRLNATVFNSIVGTLSVVVVYRIGLHLFHERVARRAATLSAFFPSMIIWSSVALKDCVITFFILVALLNCIRLRERFSASAVVGMLIPIVAIYPIRFYMVYFLAVSLAGTLALNRPGRIFAGITKQLLLLGVVALIVSAIGFRSTANDDMSYFALENMSSYRHGMAATANSGFAQDVNISTPGGAALFLPLGIVMMLWAPFPWQMTSLRPLLTLPEMLVWWSMVPALIRGARYALTTCFTKTLPIIVFSVILLIGYGLVMGNVGAAFRMRAQVLNLLFLFVAFGEYAKRAARLDIDVEELVH